MKSKSSALITRYKSCDNKIGFYLWHRLLGISRLLGNKNIKKIFFFCFIFFLSFNSISAIGQVAKFEASVFPSDTLLVKQYYLDQINAIEAWDINHDSPEIIVAVIDSGIDIDHPDLKENIWQNTDEVAGDGLDNDGNGYVDDINGWDFVLKVSDPNPKLNGDFTSLGLNHGTLVAGVIGAIGDNDYGISGISWNIKIMPLKVMDSQGSGATSLVYEAINYAIENKADIINLSMVGNAFDPRLDKVIKKAYEEGMIIVAAAGNETADGSGGDVSIDLARQPQYPICHDGKNTNYVLGVGSVDASDVKSKFSNFGTKCLDLVAPGESFYGARFYTPVLKEYREFFGGYWSGTSLATPQVSATAALIKSMRPDLINQEIYQIIIDNTDNINDRNLRYKDLLGSGRLNIKKALEAAGGQKVVNNLIIAPQTGHSPQIKLIDSSGTKRSEFMAYNKNFNGGVSIASSDINNDGQKEIITSAGKGGGPHVRIFNVNGKVISQFFAYSVNFTGGVNIIAGNVDKNNESEIITAPQSNLQPLVKIYTSNGILKNEFLAFDKYYRGEVNLALADINVDGINEIVVSKGKGGNSEIRIFNSDGKQLSKFLAYHDGFKGGIKIAAYNVFGDPRTEILTIPQSGRKSEVKIFSPTGNLITQWDTFNKDYKNGSSISIGNVDADNQIEIIIAKSVGGNAEISIFNTAGKLKSNFKVFENDFRGGVNVMVR